MVIERDSLLTWVAPLLLEVHLQVVTVWKALLLLASSRMAHRPIHSVHPVPDLALALLSSVCRAPSMNQVSAVLLWGALIQWEWGHYHPLVQGGLWEVGGSLLTCRLPNTTSPLDIMMAHGSWTACQSFLLTPMASP